MNIGYCTFIGTAAFFLRLIFSYKKLGIKTDTVKVDENGNVDLYTFGEITNSLNNMIGDINIKLFYVERGLERYKDTTGEAYLTEVQSLMNAKILPIKSDPTDSNGDGDGISDRYDETALYDTLMPEVFEQLIESNYINYYDISRVDLDLSICTVPYAPI